MQVPPLRLRPADVPPLASFWLSQAVRTQKTPGEGRPIKLQISADAIRRLQVHMALEGPSNTPSVSTTLVPRTSAAHTS